MKKKSGKTKQNPPLPRVTEEMRRWCVLLADECLRWPGVTSRKMFGMNALYRGEVIFAALPDKRALLSADSIIFKLQQPTEKDASSLKSDPQTQLNFGVKQKWFGCAIHEDSDLRDAIEWLAKAYEHARLSPKKSAKRAKR